jgi:hypothetical protein
MTENWNRTRFAADRLDAAGKRDAAGKYGSYHIIGRDTPINGGVYIGTSQREALVVDFAQDATLAQLYASALDERMHTGSFNKKRILSGLAEIIQCAARYDEHTVAALTHDHGVTDDGLVLVGMYFANNAVVCRHQALAAGAILERFIHEGHLTGTVSVDRNSNAYGAHAWVRYVTGTDQRVCILDATQQFCGYLDDAPATGWSYRRPDE